MKKRRAPSLSAWAMFAAILFATLGPGFCRAMMAAEPAGRAAATCCSDEPPSAPDRNESQDSCPLHAVGNIQLLPAAARAASVAAPSVPLGDAPAFAPPAPLSEIFSFDRLAVRAGPPGHALSQRTPLYLLIASLRI